MKKTTKKMFAGAMSIVMLSSLSAGGFAQVESPEARMQEELLKAISYYVTIDSKDGGAVLGIEGLDVLAGNTPITYTFDEDGIVRDADGTIVDFSKGNAEEKKMSITITDEAGNIKDQDGNILGNVNIANDMEGLSVDDDGNILDADGNIVGKVKTDKDITLKTAKEIEEGDDFVVSVSICEEK